MGCRTGEATGVLAGAAAFTDRLLLRLFQFYVNHWKKEVKAKQIPDAFLTSAGGAGLGLVVSGQYFPPKHGNSLLKSF